MAPYLFSTYPPFLDRPKFLRLVLLVNPGLQQLAVAVLNKPSAS